MISMHIISFIIFILSTTLVKADTCDPFLYSDRNCGSYVPNLYNYTTCKKDNASLQQQYEGIISDKFGEDANKVGSDFVIEFKQNNVYLNWTLVKIGGSLNNTFGYLHYVNATGNVEIHDNLWKLSKNLMSNCIKAGDNLEFGPFDEGDKMTFFSHCSDIGNGFCNHTVKVCSAPSFDEDFCLPEVSASLHYYHESSGTIIFGFEDSFTDETDYSYHDLILALAIPKEIETPSYPVYTNDSNVFFCDKNEPETVVEWFGASFGLFGGHEDPSHTTKLISRWETIEESVNLSALISEHEELTDRCIIHYDIANNEVIETYGCNPEEEFVEMPSEGCVNISSSSWLIFQMGSVSIPTEYPVDLPVDPPSDLPVDPPIEMPHHEPFNSSSKCINECYIENNVELKEGETIYFENAVVYLKGNLSITKGGTLDIVGENTTIVIIGDGVLTIEGGYLNYTMSENQFNNVNGFDHTIASGNIDYKEEMTLRLPKETEKKFKGEIRHEGKSLTLVFVFDKNKWPWYAIVLVCVAVMAAVAIAMLIILNNKRLRNKVLPFR